MNAQIYIYMFINRYTRVTARTDVQYMAEALSLRAAAASSVPARGGLTLHFPAGRAREKGHAGGLQVPAFPARGGRARGGRREL